ncbi:MAG: hypothetical protein ONB12_02710 [candidate division KSB1 bacterium]|nr:hypothetical protein [candidate division KSB1 bacterium]
MSWFVEKARSLRLLSYQSISKREKKFRALDLGQTIRSAKRVCFCLPALQESLDAAGRMVEQFSRSFPDCEAVLLTFYEGGIRQWFRAQQVILVRPEDLNWYGHPKTSLLKRAGGRTFDLALDLNIAYDFTSLATIWQTDALLRIGFYDPIREPFYSFMFHPHPETPAEKAYQQFFNLLVQFK